jgi:hypothetical protein
MYLFLFLFLTLYMFRAHRAHHQEVTSDLHTTRPPTQSDSLPEVVLTQFVSPDDEHDVLETCRELKIKINI